MNKENNIKTLIPKIEITKKENLFFKSPDIMSDRADESFSVGEVEEKLKSSALNIISSSLEFLPVKYWPSCVYLDLEFEGTIQFDDGTKETFPISLVMSQQQPSKSKIRLGMFEIQSSMDSFNSILAHELGHMLVEWACRKSQVTPNDQPIMSHWSKTIYEGVADWFACILTGSNIVGSKKTWFYRDIFQYKTLQEAQTVIGAMPKVLGDGLGMIGLIPKYRSYNEWMELVKFYFGEKADPYAEGQWVASQLWEMSQGKLHSMRVMEKIIDLSITGKEFTDPEIFLLELKNSLSIINLKKYRVIEDWKVVYTNPIKLKKGERVIIDKIEDDPNWLGWVFCRNQLGVAGWVSKKYIQFDTLDIIGEGTVILDYDATELNITCNQIVRGHYDEFGWAWAENQDGILGWVPLKNLSPLESETVGLV